MNAFVVSALVVCSLGQLSEALFLVAAPAAAGAAVGATTVGVGATTAVAGLAAIKAVALLAGAAAERGGRFRRAAGEEGVSALEEEAAFAVIAKIEPEACYRRLICDLATGQLPKVRDNDVILSLFDREASIASPKFDFSTAAKLGQELKNVETCEVRYSCPISGQQLNELLN